MEHNFEKYDQENPRVWQAFIHFTIQAKAKGFQNYGAKGIFEQIRWHTGVTGNDGFKLNNNYAPDYARKFEKEFPHYAGFFRTRVLRKVRKSKAG